MRKNSGYGLTETLVALALGSMLLLLLHRFLVPVLLASSENSTQVHLSQQANLLLQRMEQDLKESDGSGLSYLEPAGDNSPVALAICRRAGLSPEGVKLYEDKLRVYFLAANSGEVRLRELKLGEPPLPASHDPTAPLRLTPEQLNNLTSNTNGSKLLSTSVVEFRPLDNWPVEAGAQFLLRLEQSVGGAGKMASYTIEKRIGFR